MTAKPPLNPNPDPALHGAIPVWNAENWFYEDIEIGRRIRSIRRTISEGESMLFYGLVLVMHPYVADDIFAREDGRFGKRLVAGAMVFSLGLGLVATNCVNAFSYGYDKLRFIKPVFIGDTITCKVTISDKRGHKRPGHGIVVEHLDVMNQRGEVVLVADHLLLVEQRGA